MSLRMWPKGPGFSAMPWQNMPPWSSPIDVDCQFKCSPGALLNNRLHPLGEHDWLNTNDPILKADCRLFKAVCKYPLIYFSDWITVSLLVVIISLFRLKLAWSGQDIHCAYIKIDPSGGQGHCCYHTWGVGMSKVAPHRLSTPTTGHWSTIRISRQFMHAIKQGMPFLKETCLPW